MTGILRVVRFGGFLAILASAVGCRDDSGSAVQFIHPTSGARTQGWSWGDDSFGWDNFMEIAIQAVGVSIAVAAVLVAVSTARATEKQATIAADQAKRATFLDESSQAPLVGGYIDRQLGPMRGYVQHATMVMTVHNASPLPVRDVRGYLVRADQIDPVGQFVPKHVMEGQTTGNPGLLRLETDIPETDAEGLVLVLEFDDDAGVRWRKYLPGRPPLERAADSPRGWPDPE